MARNYKNFGYFVAVLALFAMSGNLAACQAVIDEPVPPIPGEPTPNAVIYKLQMIWNRSDFISLQSMTIDHPASIRFATGGTNDSLDVSLRLEVQKENSEQFKDEYKKELQKLNADTLSGANPKITIPRRECHQTKNITNLITDMTGICVRELTITLPAVSSSPPLSFNLDWTHELRAEGVTLNRLEFRVPDFSITRLTQVTGNVGIRGGGDFSTLILDQIKGTPNPFALDVDLSSVKNFYASGITGGIKLDIKNHSNSDVQVDWVPIHEFPYIHP